MRLRLVWLAAVAVACGSEPAPDAAKEPQSAEPAKTAESTIPKPQPKEEAPPVPTFEAPGVGPMPQGRSVAGFPTVAIQGYGMRFEVKPPFQATRMTGLYTLDGKDGADVMVISWWDVADPDAGKHGRAGLYNIGLVPAVPQPEGTTFEPVAYLERGKRVVRGMRLGKDGGLLRFPDDYNALGGMGTLSVGPAEEKWTVQVGDAPPVDFAESGVMLHSWDPASGSPIHFDRKISKPFGDWPKTEPPPAAPASGAAPPKK